MSNKLGIFVGGALLGAAAVFFTSPRSGFENRNLVKDALGAICDTSKCGTTEAASSAVQAAAGKGQDLLKVAEEKGAEFYATASNKVQEVIKGLAPSAETDTDELRKKIEAARQRIAAQVVKNAEESQLVQAESVAVDEPVEAVVVEAEEA